MHRTVIAGVVAAGLLAALGGAAWAQTAGARGDTSKLPVMVGADDGELSETAFSLTGRAEVTQGDTRLRADRITGVRSSGQVTSVNASGNVYYVTPTETVRGDRAEYNVGNATIVVSGDVILNQGKSVLTGSRLTYNVDTRSASMDGGGANGRVQGVFYPQGAN